MKFRQAFGQFAKRTARFTGSPVCFAVAVLVVLAWAAAGPVFHYSENWQLVINTGTTIVTFLMVFLIQTTQNADTDAMQIKLDELIRALEPANNRMLALEELDEDTLADLRRQFDAMARKARADENGEVVGEVDPDQLAPDAATAGHGGAPAGSAREPHSPA
jgi:low affinity Fe/Cu permease